MTSIYVYAVIRKKCLSSHQRKLWKFYDFHFVCYRFYCNTYHDSSIENIPSYSIVNYIHTYIHMINMISLTAMVLRNWEQLSSIYLPSIFHLSSTYLPPIIHLNRKAWRSFLISSVKNSTLDVVLRGMI